MRIGIDISPVVYDTGVSSYTRNLVRALLSIDKGDEFVLFGGSLRRMGELHNYYTQVAGDSAEKIFPLPPTLMDLVWNRLHVFPVEWLVGDLDVFHSSDWTQPPTGAFKVTTIHDLAPLRFPSILHPKIVATHQRRLEWVAKEVDSIIAVSEFTKQEIVELLGINPEKIRVIHEAPDPSIKPNSKSEINSVKIKYKIGDNYLLVVGADPRKNILAIIQAFTKINEKLKLVIVGRLWEPLPENGSVISVGHVSQEDLVALYSGAQALVYTSLYEGFGLPILEAMQAGCPVVTSNISSMPEVADDAAVMVDPTNPQEIANGIKEVLSERPKWIKKGLARAKEFSWERAARKTLEVYKEAK